MSLKKNNTSGYPGVYYASNVKKWVAQIKIDGKQIRLANFELKEDAIQCRKEAEIKYDFHENHGK